MGKGTDEDRSKLMNCENGKVVKGVEVIGNIQADRIGVRKHKLL